MRIKWYLIIINVCAVLIAISTSLLKEVAPGSEVK